MKFPAYELVKETAIPELNSVGKVLYHKKTGARVFLMENDDENKVFTIGFRTPPYDDTGLPHILEHSVLCGSRKFPAKDPFVELAKGSLNTFLNAMTYPDKTVYPLASCNDKDFQNLMDVYLDAVFYPNIYTNEKIFRQEGWHYELEDLESPITVNGVVYNEMKGAFSSPDGVAERYLKELIYPDTAYANESGGDPKAIPTLSYEDFLAFHKKYYHPSNSYIYLYGAMDMEEKLAWIDEEYLSKFDRITVESAIEDQKPFSEMALRETFYNVAEGEETEEKTYLVWGKSVGTVLDPKLYSAFQILEYALLSAPGAPLKQALLDAGIGSDIDGGYDNSFRQPIFSLMARETEADKKDEFVRVIDETLKKIASEGLNRKSLLAGIVANEFKIREADFGQWPKGLMYGLQCFDSWLHADEEPEMHLLCDDVFRFLKESVETGYYEDLIRTYLIDNQHGGVLVLAPETGLAAKDEQELAQRLADFKASLTEAQLEEIIEQTAALKRYQTEPTPEEDLLTIPMLSVSDIRREVRDFRNCEDEIDGVKFLSHPYATNGIGYVTWLFDATAVDPADYGWLSLLKAFLSYMDTETYSYQDLSDEINLYTGGIDFGLTTYSNDFIPEDCRLLLEVQTSFLRENCGHMVRLLEEVLKHTKFEDEKRMKELVSQMKIRLQSKLNDAGHSASVQRASSYFSLNSWVGDRLSGIEMYEFLEDLEADWDEKKELLKEKMNSLLGELLCRDTVLVDITAEEDLIPEIMQAVKALPASFPMAQKKAATVPMPAFEAKNEGFATSSQVSYDAQCGNFRDAGYEFTGAMRILKTIMSYDYLWQNIRVVGGAYGCMSGFGRNGESYFVSYRDPNVKGTYDIFAGVPAYLESFDCGKRDLDRFIIGTISSVDTPLTPRMQGRRSLGAWMSGVTVELVQKERDQILDATVEDIRALAGPCRAILAGGYVCAIGSAEKINADADCFKVVKSLSV